MSVDLVSVVYETVQPEHASLLQQGSDLGTEGYEKVDSVVPAEQLPPP